MGFEVFTKFCGALEEVEKERRQLRGVRAGFSLDWQIQAPQRQPDKRFFFSLSINYMLHNVPLYILTQAQIPSTLD